MTIKLTNFERQGIDLAKDMVKHIQRVYPTLLSKGSGHMYVSGTTPFNSTKAVNASLHILMPYILNSRFTPNFALVFDNKDEHSIQCYSYNRDGEKKLYFFKVEWKQTQGKYSFNLTENKELTDIPISMRDLIKSSDDNDRLHNKIPGLRRLFFKRQKFYEYHFV